MESNVIRKRLNTFKTSGEGLGELAMMSLLMCLGHGKIGMVQQQISTVSWV